MPKVRLHFPGVGWRDATAGSPVANGRYMVARGAVIAVRVMMDGQLVYDDGRPDNEPVDAHIPISELIA